jgi:L-seryl-tRNA(Ser) seleniumtransferase
MSHEFLQTLLRKLPKIDALLRLPGMDLVCESHGRERVTEALRAAVEDLRRDLSEGRPGPRSLESWMEELPGCLARILQEELQTSLVPVINAAGVLLHTNLGRAPLSAAALSRVRDLSGVYTTLEYDLASGRRGSRSVHAQRILSRLFPGCAAHVVNNNAAAVLLAINGLAEGREVVVSRGELIEIGGSFRIPDVMRKGQAILKEVGTTNRTRLSDYEDAIGSQTALLLKVHTSNYRIVGFTTQVSLPELAALGKRRGLPVMVDQGSGNLLDLAPCGLKGEPRVAGILAQGADLVTFSGDKLLGGPQCGILVGRPDLIERLRKNPLSRALRVDKLTYAALEATLEAYVTEQANKEVPVLRMLEESAESVGARAGRCAQRVRDRSAGRVRVEIISGSSLVGGGAAPTVEIPTRLLEVSVAGKSADELERMLRKLHPPVIARIQEDRLVLDLRTVLPDQEEGLATAVASLGGEDLTR